MAKGKAQDNFRAKAPGIMNRLMAEFPLWNEYDAAADLGNLGHESGGLATLQETNPTVKGSRGGYGWPQWTGPRRRAYEAWCKKNKLNPASDAANLGYHLVELHGEYSHVIGKVHAAPTLELKVKAFELGYEGAGIKHYDSRNQWARIALDAWLAEHARPAPKPTPSVPPPVAPPAAPVVVNKPVVADPGELHKPVTKTKTFWTWLLTILGAPLAAFGGLDFRVQLVIIGLIVIFGVYGITRRAQLAQAVRDLHKSFEA